MIYREATREDSDKIALLHAQSWQKHYQGILREEYLQNQVKEDRIKVWQERLQHPKKNQYILVAEDDAVICGLACVYANHDPVWGSLLDNLHVFSTYQGKGIGNRLIRSAATWAYHHTPKVPFYLWVYAKNKSAQAFYANLGGIHEETAQVENPGGGYGEVYRIVWRNVAMLIH